MALGNGSKEWIKEMTEKNGYNKTLEKYLEEKIERKREEKTRNWNDKVKVNA